jgi:hypothetical protein
MDDQNGIDTSNGEFDFLIRTKFRCPTMGVLQIVITMCV